MNTPEHLLQNIILCGFMGTGKSSVGRILAERLGWQFVDTDVLIEQREGRTISAIFAEDGEVKFRDLESAVAAELVSYRHTVIATGGGIVLRRENLANLERAGLVVCLDAPAEEIVRRLAQFTDRPLLAGDDPAARIAELLDQRKAAYGAIKQHVNTANRTAEQVADAIRILWRTPLRQQTADDIKVLTALEAVRVRPALYLGVRPHAIYNMLYAVLDDSINQTIAGLCKHINLIIHRDSSVTISDDGIGIPVTVHPYFGLTLLEIEFTKMLTGRIAREYPHMVGGGMHGIGLIPVNALSERLNVEVRRDGFVWRQSYARGVRTSDVLKIRPMADSESTGTTITFYPDAQIFDGVRKDYDFDYESLAERCRQLAYLLPGVAFRLLDERVKPLPLETTFCIEGGLESYVKYLNRDCIALHVPISGVKVFQLDRGEPNRQIVEVAFAFQYTNDAHTTELGFVNTVETTDGGTYLTGLHAALTHTINNWVRKMGHRVKSEIEFTSGDIRKGLTVIVSLKHPYPQFESMVILRLMNPEIENMVESSIASVFADYLEQNPEDAQRIVENYRPVLKNA